MCKSVCPWCTAIGAGGRFQKPEGSRCSEMYSQPYLSTPTFLHILVLSPIVLTCKIPEPNYFFPRVRAQLFFSLIFRAQLFFQRISGHDYFFQFYTRPPPPPPPWISNGQCLMSLYIKKVLYHPTALFKLLPANSIYRPKISGFIWRGTCKDCRCPQLHIIS